MPVYIVLTRARVKAMARKPRRTAPKVWQAYLLPVKGGHAHLVTHPRLGVTLWGFNRLGVFVPWWKNLSWYGDLLVIKRRKQAADGQPVTHLAPMETNLLANHLALVTHCAATQFDDGTPRKPGWFTVRTRGSAWEVEIKDPETCSRLVVIQQTIDDVLALAVVLLDAEDAPWERDPWLQQQAAKSKKK